MDIILYYAINAINFYMHVYTIPTKHWEIAMCIAITNNHLHGIDDWDTSCAATTYHIMSLLLW